MAVAADFPVLDDRRRLLGLASFRMTAEEFRAAVRANLETLPWMRSWPRWAAFFGLWHAALATGIWLLVGGAQGKDGPVDGAEGFFACVLTVGSALVLWRMLYGVPFQIRRLFRTFPGAGDESAFAFTPDRFHSHVPLGDSSCGWEFLREVIEFEDGFLCRLKTAPGGIWLPDHALTAPFDHFAAAELFRSKVPDYRVVHRRVGG
jgi:hypothetical protein